MSLNTRLTKLEQRQESIGVVAIACIIVNEVETEEVAYERCFPDGSKKPKTVIYGTPLDVLL